MYKIFCRDTESILPSPVGELRQQGDDWHIVMRDRGLCPSASGFVGSFAECERLLSAWFRCRLEEVDSDADADNWEAREALVRMQIARHQREQMAKRMAYKIGQRVAVKGKETVRVVTAGYVVQIWNYYTLSGLEGWLVREDQLETRDVDGAKGFVPSPMNLLREEHHAEKTT